MKTEYMELEEGIKELRSRQERITEEANKRHEERMREWDVLLKKLKTTTDMAFILSILQEKTIVGTRSCSFYEFQAAAQNKNLNEEVFNFLLGFEVGEQLLFNAGLSFEQRCKVLKLFWIERGR